MQWNILQASIRCQKVVSDGSAGLLPVFYEILCNIQGHGQSCWVNTWNSFIRKVASGDVELGRVGGAWEKEGNKRVRGRQWERNTRESATFFLLKPIKYGPGLLKTRGLPEYWLWPGLGRLCSLLNRTLHCPTKAAHMVLTHKHTQAVMLAVWFSPHIQEINTWTLACGWKKGRFTPQKICFSFLLLQSDAWAPESDELKGSIKFWH